MWHLVEGGHMTPNQLSMAGKWCTVGINDESIGGSTTRQHVLPVHSFLQQIRTTVATTDDGRTGRWAGLALMLVDPIVISTIHLDASSEEKKCHPVHSLDALP